MTNKSYPEIVNPRTGHTFRVFAGCEPAYRNKHTGALAVKSGRFGGGELVALDGSCYWQNGDSWKPIA